MNSLMTKLTPGDLRDCLRGLPQGERGLEQTYEQTMERINFQEAESKSLATGALSWITLALSPLRRRELLHALAVRANTFKFDKDYLPDLEDLISLCAGLVTYSEDDDRVIFGTFYYPNIFRKKLGILVSRRSVKCYKYSHDLLIV
jgi:hypothetical protein